LKEAKNALNGFYELLATRLVEPEERTSADKGLMEVIARCRVAFREAMDNDFNTPVAIATLQGMRSSVNKLLDQGLSTDARKIARAEFRSLGNCLGLFQLEQWQFSQMPIGQAVGMENPYSSRPRVMEMSQTGIPLTIRVLADTEIQLKVDERNEARKQKDFKKADEIRQSLASCGILIEDKPDGTSRWKR
jgi:cysteinyl-tRNA synthetase